MNRWDLYDKQVEFSSLLGEVLTEIDNHGESMTFKTSDGKEFYMYHSQSCCENVSIEDITGDLNDLIGLPISMAEESSSNEDPDDFKRDESEYYSESFTWTFYKLATVRGYVTIRWYGSSNGYYSESVDFARIK